MPLRPWHVPALASRALSAQSSVRPCGEICPAVVRGRLDVDQMLLVDSGDEHGQRRSLDGLPRVVFVELHLYSPVVQFLQVLTNDGELSEPHPACFDCTASRDSVAFAPALHGSFHSLGHKQNKDKLRNLLTVSCQLQIR